MAEVQPFRTLRYDPAVVGSLDDVIAPPYDVIDEEERARLAARSPYNVVKIDLPPSYEQAAETMHQWRERGVLVREDEPAVWVLRQDYAAPDGAERTRTGFFVRVRVEEYGPGRIRPHERTHPGPKEDRLNLTRATRANLSPIFSLFPDPDTIERVAAILAEKELLIADGHHRYETARVYAEEVGGEGEHRYVLMFLCSMSDPGLLVFPTHRLLSGLKDDTPKQVAIRDVLRANFDLEELADPRELEPPPGDGRVAFGYMDSF